MKLNNLRIYLLSLQSRKSMFGNYYKSKQGRAAAASLPFFLSTHFSLHFFVLQSRTKKL